MTIDPTGRVVVNTEAARAAASLIALLQSSQGPRELRDLAVALRGLAGALDQMTIGQHSTLASPDACPAGDRHHAYPAGGSPYACAVPAQGARGGWFQRQGG